MILEHPDSVGQMFCAEAMHESSHSGMSQATAETNRQGHEHEPVGLWDEDGQAGNGTVQGLGQVSNRIGGMVGEHPVHGQHCRGREGRMAGGYGCPARAQGEGCRGAAPRNGRRGCPGFRMLAGFASHRWFQRGCEAILSTVRI